MTSVLVVGAGVAGLTSAAALLEAGYSVRVAGRELSPDTTSAVAAAFWYPYRAYPPDAVTRLAQVGLRRYAALADEPGAGVLHREAIELFPGAPEVPAWAPAADEFAVLDPPTLPPGFASGFRFRTAVVEMPVYLRWLEARVRRLGGEIERRSFHDLGQALGEAPIVVHCAGLGARELAPDAEVHAIRGQVVRVANPGLRRVWIDEYSGPEITYIVPRSHDVVLGGTSEPHVEGRTPDPAQTRAILERCARLEPSLAGARILSVGVGLRPARPHLRLEAERRDGGLVVHNYGHGGAGVTLSWGCAEAVRELVAAERSP
jgi:D-amino-acid oxidase